MANQRNHRHLSAERIQAFLEGELPGREAAALEEHASSCARCAGELEGWRLLFSQLRELPALAPSQGFQERVMEGLDLRRPLLERLRGWLGARRRVGARVAGHLPPERVQDYVEGLLPAGQVARVREHLGECGRCQRQEAVWRRLMAGLDGLPRLEPAPTFAARVMANVHIPQRMPARVGASLLDRTLKGAAGWFDALGPMAGGALAMARKLQPRTRRAWTLVGGAVAAPVAVFAVTAYYVASSPLLSVSNLSTFLWWKTSEVAASLGGGVTQTLLESQLATQGYALLTQATGSAGAVAGVGAAFCVLTVLSLYVLYRNLTPTHPVEHRYVHFSF